MMKAISNTASIHRDSNRKTNPGTWPYCYKKGKMEEIFSRYEVFQRTYTLLNMQ